MIKTHIPARPRNKKIVPTGGASISPSISSAVGSSHTHNNKPVIDKLTQANIDVLSYLSLYQTGVEMEALLDEFGDPVYDEFGAPVMVDVLVPVLDEFGNPVLDVNGNPVMETIPVHAIRSTASFFSEKEISAFGIGEGSGGGGGGFDMLLAWDNYSPEKSQWVISAALGKGLMDRIVVLEGGGSGGGSTVTWGAESGGYVPLTVEGVSKSVALSTHNHSGVYEPVFTKNTAFNKDFGTTAGTVSEGNHTHTKSNITDWFVSNSLANTAMGSSGFFAGAFVAGSTNYFGIYSGSTNYGTGIVGRFNKLYFQTLENGTLQGWNEIYHSGNFTPENYLPLTGGTLTGNVTAPTLSVTGILNSVGLTYGKAINKSGVDANTLTLAGFYDGLNMTNMPNAGWFYLTVERFSTDTEWAHQTATSLGSGNNQNRIYSRAKVSGIWESWSEVAFLTDNVASATKLQTARTIWGQSFNGSANVTGALTEATTITASASVTTPKVIFAAAGWSLEQVGTEIQYKYNGVVKQRMLSDGSIVATGEVTAFVAAT